MVVIAAITNLSYSTTLYAFSVLLGERATAGKFDRALLSRVTQELRATFRALNAVTSTPSRQKLVTHREARKPPRSVERLRGDELSSQGGAPWRPWTQTILLPRQAADEPFDDGR